MCVYIYIEYLFACMDLARDISLETTSVTSIHRGLRRDIYGALLCYILIKLETNFFYAYSSIKWYVTAKMNFIREVAGSHHTAAPPISLVESPETDPVPVEYADIPMHPR